MPRRDRPVGRKSKAQSATSELADASERLLPPGSMPYAKTHRAIAFGPQASPVDRCHT
jgi:hypothetical protein